MTANNVTLSTDFNVDPYYDDFNESKNFHRILFRPGFAVQARELTQMQSILQNQVDRFASHIFKEGSIVEGCEINYDGIINYVKIRDSDFEGNTVTANSFVNKTITGVTTGATAFVIDSLTGSEANSPNTKTLYIRYSGSGANGTVQAFQSGEKLTSTSGNTANVCTEGVQTANVVGTASRISFGKGIIFAKDHFIRVDASNTIIGRYNANASFRIGYTVTETIVSADDDSTLEDPAQGAYNYAAPGADRLKLEAVITKKLVSDTSTTNFTEIARIRNGLLENAVSASYNIINDYLARRTYDESGNYIVNGLTTRVREHLNSANNGGVFTAGNGGNTSLLSVDIAPGKAYVKGYEYESLTTGHVPIEKATEFNSVEDISIPSNYGNYVVVDNVVGTWDLNGHDRVDLYNVKMNAIANNSFSSLSPRGTKIGEARVRALELASGSKGAANGEYNMYLYDVSMTANSFSFVRSIFFNNSSFDGFADPVLESGSAVIKESEFNRALFEIPAKNIKTIRDEDGNIDNDYRFIKKFSVTIASGGTVTVTTGSADEQFPFSTGLINDTQENDNFHVVLEATANSASALDTTVTRSSQSNTITGLTNATTKYNVGDSIKMQGDANTYTISEVVSNSSVKVYGPGKGPALSNKTIFKAFKSGQVIPLNGYGGTNAARTVNITSTTSAVIDIKETLSSGVDASVYVELKKVDGQEIAKVINKNRFVEINISSSGTTTGPWGLGLSDGHKLRSVRFKTGNTFFSSVTQGTDVTSQFELDTGMSDNLYDHAKLKLKPNASHSVANGNVYLVKFDYFTHDTSSGKTYFSVDSYPIDDANTANTTAIQTAEIPVFTSKVSGTRYDLRNHIDIRPRITDTANSVTSLTNISRNPASSTEIVEPAGSLRYMAPNEDFESDFDYYLSRKDRIVLTSTGGLRSVRGVADLFPKTPDSPSDGMTLAIVDVKPYPSLPQENANKISTATSPNGRSDLSIQIQPTRTRRYTMRDIRGLEERIENLEYYTSLSLLEGDTKSKFLADDSGVDRFKNGFIVDQFVDFTVSDVFDSGFKISIDRRKKELRPSFKLDDVQLEFKSANSSNITATSKDARITLSSNGTFTKGGTVTQGAASGTLDYQVGTRLYLSGVSGTFSTAANVVQGAVSRAVSSVKTPSAGKLIMLPWTHDATVEQAFATDTRNPSGIGFLYQGTLILNPDMDYWKSTVTKPTVTVDFGGLSTAIAQIANFNGVKFISGFTPVSKTETQSGHFNKVVTTESRTGSKIAASIGDLIETDLGSSVKDVNLIPFMRSRVLQFIARGLKPSTRMYAFFDDTDVNAYCSPANSSFANTASEGSNLKTDSSGTIRGLFRIPEEDNLAFPIGRSIFRLTSSSTNSTGPNSIAEDYYTAHGLSATMQGTIISTRGVNFSTQSVTETRVTETVREQPRAVFGGFAGGPTPGPGPGTGGGQCKGPPRPWGGFIGSGGASGCQLASVPTARTRSALWDPSDPLNH